MMVFEAWNRDPPCRRRFLSKVPKAVVHTIDDVHHPVVPRYSVYAGLIYGLVCMHVISEGAIDA